MSQLQLYGNPRVNRDSSPLRISRYLGSHPTPPLTVTRTVTHPPTSVSPYPSRERGGPVEYLLTGGPVPIRLHPFKHDLPSSTSTPNMLVYNTTQYNLQDYVHKKTFEFFMGRWSLRNDFF